MRALSAADSDLHAILTRRNTLEGGMSVLMTETVSSRRLNAKVMTEGWYKRWQAYFIRRFFVRAWAEKTQSWYVHESYI